MSKYAEDIKEMLERMDNVEDMLVAICDALEIELKFDDDDEPEAEVEEKEVEEMLETIIEEEIKKPEEYKNVNSGKSVIINESENEVLVFDEEERRLHTVDKTTNTGKAKLLKLLSKD
tara:strand:+ start:91 stop:444 length:354 start_codon:yes stop_codon:yes gene_type:complete